MQTSPVGTRFSCTYNQIKYNTQLQYPQSRNKHVSCLHDNFVYIYAGKDGTISLRDFWRFNIGTQTWQQVNFRGDNPLHLEGHTLVSCKKLLLLFGGEFGDSLTESSLWIINPDLEYVRKCNLDPGSERPSVRRHHTAVVYRGCMFVYGGYVDMKGSSSELWQYRIDDEEWDLLLPRQLPQEIPSGLHCHSAVVFQKNMWVYGGMSNLIPKQDLWCYSFVSSRWDKLKLKYGPPPLTGHSAVVVGSQMFIYGGECNRESVNQLWCFCFKTELWTQVQCHQHIPSARMFHSAIIVSPSQKSDSSVKASSMPYLQKKMKVMELDRPRTSPSSRSQGSLQFSEMHFSDKDSRPQVLNLMESSNSCESLKIIPSPAENTKDHSPLVPKKTDLNFNILHKSSVMNGIDNPGISNSTEELIRESQILRLSKLNQGNEQLNSIPYFRTQHYDRQKSEGFDYSGIKSSDYCIEQKSDISDYTDMELNEQCSRGAKKFRPDPELIIEDLEYKDCFPHDIRLPYPSSRSALKNFHGAGSHDYISEDEEVETIELTDLKTVEEKEHLGDYQISEPSKSRTSCDPFCAQNQRQTSKDTKFTYSKTDDAVKKSNNDSDSMLVDVNETVAEIQNHSNCHDVNFCSVPNDRIKETQFGTGNTDASTNSSSGKRTSAEDHKTEQQDKEPYMLIFGGKEKQVSNFGIRPLAIWKCKFKKL